MSQWGGCYRIGAAGYMFRRRSWKYATSLSHVTSLEQMKLFSHHTLVVKISDKIFRILLRLLIFVVF